MIPHVWYKKAEHIQTESRTVVARNWAGQVTDRCWSEDTNFQVEDE